MKIIQLYSNKYPDLKCFVDDEDYNILVEYKWHPCVNTKWNTIYVTTNMNNKTVKLHRFIMQSHDYDITKMLVDHKDRNGLNNQKENLRICDYSKNAQNSKRNPIYGSSNYKGVYLYKRTNKYRANIKLKGKRIYLGYFDSDKEAALAYNKKAIELFGEYACLNIITF